MNSSPLPETDKRLTKPGKLAWRLLLSVIVIYCFFFAFNLIVLAASLLNFFGELHAYPNVERFSVTGLFAALFYLWLIIGLLNRKKVIRNLAFLEIVYSIYIFGIMLYGALFNEINKIGFGIQDVFYFHLDKVWIIIFSTSLLSLQVYKSIVILRKDVCLLFQINTGAN